jgi:hypothetical protein
MIACHPNVTLLPAQNLESLRDVPNGVVKVEFYRDAISVELSLDVCDLALISRSVA